MDGACSLLREHDPREAIELFVEFRERVLDVEEGRARQEARGEFVEADQFSFSAFVVRRAETRDAAKSLLTENECHDARRLFGLARTFVRSVRHELKAENDPPLSQPQEGTGFVPGVGGEERTQFLDDAARGGRVHVVAVTDRPLDPRDGERETVVEAFRLTSAHGGFLGKSG